ncbi:TetR family transcriptional regulator [Iocasia frigidifontis]|uniref:TetR family transcriptional regulator n=2 Tax=Iocasia fonsfrigidae TaxID=2682810 RepID=A0A8A7KJN2_9FIRM|nr:TetR family transcriptional regulator [Iocasia fonsfrigidae]
MFIKYILIDRIKGVRYMPKETFFNLVNEKKERVIEAAIDEFALRPYHQARITAIADNASIAKGSFYQYFEDKKDLFKYIIELSVNKKLKYINLDMIKNKDKYSFFQLLREVYLSGFRFAKRHPKLLAVASKLANNKELYREIFGEYKDKSLEFFLELLEQGIVEGAIDSKIDPVFVAKMLTNISYTLSDFIYEDGEIDLNNIDESMEIIDKMLYFIENGLKKRD